MKNLRKFASTVLAVLREIFDENGYQRFLARTGSVASVESYQRFMKEHEAGLAQKPRCC